MSDDKISEIEQMLHQHTILLAEYGTRLQTLQENMAAQTSILNSLLETFQQTKGAVTAVKYVGVTIGALITLVQAVPTISNLFHPKH